FSSSSSILFNGLQKRLGFDFNNAIGPFISNILKFVIISLAFVLIISELGYDISGFIAGLGLSGLAFALAAQETASSIFGGIVILLDKPFAIGDWIQTPSVEGVVEDITLRSTRIRTFANAQSVMPNATLAKEPITNWSRMGKRRITFKIGVTYSTKREKIQTCIEQIREMLLKHEDVHKETVFVYFDEFNDSSLDIFLYFFTITTNWQQFLEVKEDINYRIMDILEKENVNFAFPSRSIYIEEKEK
ncbi:MAG: mechanosensitive ion channel family protein, partial [Clostridia bacterium]|nr:mechanosensitive ion channel family protein [Clostridia bacterium]